MKNARARFRTLVVSITWLVLAGAFPCSVFASNPDIGVQPQSQTVLVNSNVTFSVTPFGSPPFTYRWQFNNTDLPTTLISTVAGIGTNGFSGDGSSASRAMVGSVNGVAVDTNGNLYIADSSNNRVRKVNTNGIIITIVGSGTNGLPGDGGAATNAGLQSPGNVAFDPAQNLFIADSGNQRIRRVGADGIISTVAGNGSTGFAGDGGPATNASLNSPVGLCFDSKGNLYIADTQNHRVRKVTTNGLITTVAGNGTWGAFAGDGGPATNATISFPMGVAVDPVGNLFIADEGNGRVRKVDTNGIITTYAGNGLYSFAGDNGPATNAALVPFAIVLDSSGNLFVADQYNSRIRRVGTNGIITTVAGSASWVYSGDNMDATNATVNFPNGVTVDRTGRLFIADTGNYRVRKVEATTNANLVFNNVTTNLAGDYRVIVSNSHGSVTSSVVTLTVLTPPSIIAQPTDQYVFAGKTATFTATAIGTGPLSYQWYLNGYSIAEAERASGTATPTLMIHDVDPIDAGGYWLVVSNAYGMTTSSVVTLTLASIRYVNVANASPVAPYTSWATAATVIQDAINASGPGDLILVTNGVYASGSVSTGKPYYATHRIALNKPLTVMSVNGPSVTTIIAQTYPYAGAGRRVAYLTNGAFLAGFTLTAGETDVGDTSSDNQRGAGVLCQSVNCIVSNCVISGCTAGRYGGGGYSGTYYNCVITGNTARDIEGARTGYGGGVYSGILINCVVANNSARYEGGGVMFGALTNCLVMNNSAVWGGGNAYASMVNCTVLNNAAYDDGGLGGGGGGGVLGGTVYNSIVVQNTGPYGTPNFSSPNMFYSCTFPHPGGTSNIVVDPLFIDSTNGNFHLQTNSPCLNVGTNLWGPGSTDLEGAPRVVDGTVDMGAYELQHTAFVVSGPSSQSVVLSSNFTFSVSAIGDEPLTYQWWFNGAPLSEGGRISGVTSNLLSITAAQTNDAGNYSVVVSNSSSATTSSVAALTVLLPVTITSQPTNKIVATGVTASFTVVASGLSTLSYAWYSNNVPLTNGGRISGANSATLNISNAQTNDAATYYVVITNSYGSLTSSNATLTVLAPVQIVTHPASQAVLLNSNATLTVAATGSEPLVYRWFFNGTLLSDNARLSGSATPMLVISNIQPSDAGGYVAVVSNQLNSATSHLAALTPIAAGATSVRYVNISNTTPLAPYLSWTNAATNIQEAVDASVAGDLILVSNGVYKTGARAVYGATNRVAVDKAVTVQSVNGPDLTIIVGGGAVGVARVNGRCVYLTNGASLIGFCLTNGNASGTNGSDTNKVSSGGGVWCESSSVIVSNCIIRGNSASQYGGGAFQGTLWNCILTNNSASKGGGACSNTLVNCTLVKNFGTFQDATSGGGAIYSTLSNCLLVANTCNGGGGGAGFSSLTSCVVSNNSGVVGGGVFMGTANYCLISSNKTFGSGGGGAYSNILNNCILKNNFTSGNGAGAYNSVLVNCTVVSNSMPSGFGAGGGIYGGAATNCIVYYNFSSKEPNFLSTMPMNYCCTPTLATNGFGNITNAPLFVDVANGDFHLQPGSPCINSGNNFGVTTENDMDGNPRVAGGTVDMGAFEFQNPVSSLSYAWAQQHGLPTDGSADYLDPDNDGVNNWQEWIAGTDPNDASSKLAVLPMPNTNTSGITITWSSVSGIPYYVQRCTNFAAQPAFSSIASNIVGQAGTTSYTDTNAVGTMPAFYRVGVQH